MSLVSLSICRQEKNREIKGRRGSQDDERRQASGRTEHPVPLFCRKVLFVKWLTNSFKDLADILFEYTVQFTSQAEGRLWETQMENAFHIYVAYLPEKRDFCSRFGDWMNDSLLLLLLLLSHFSCVQLCVNPRWQPTRLPRPWDSPGKNTGVGCHFLLQCMKVKSESEVAQSCPTLSNPMDCSPPGSSIHGIFQARVLE